MTCFAHPLMDAVLKFDEDRVPTLVIENRSFFRQIVQDIYAQTEGYSGECVLSRDLKPIEFSKNAELIDSPISFSVNQKSLLTKIVSALEKLAVNESFYLKTAELIQGIGEYFSELTKEQTAELYCSKLNISSILKAIGICVADDYASPLEEYIDYMELTREFDRDKLFIFINLRSYFPDSELQAFLETVLAHEYKILLIDNKAYDILSIEKRVIIDEDLCEIVI